MCDDLSKMMSSMPFLVLALTSAFAAPATIYEDVAVSKVTIHIRVLAKHTFFWFRVGRD